MGNYKEETGDLLEKMKLLRFDAICHGANCFSIMGAGIAKQIAEKYPPVYEEDIKDSRSPIDKFGNLSYKYIPLYDTYIVNLYTQYEPGPNFDYRAFKKSLKAFKSHFKEGLSVGFPQIGCGIGGGNWDIVRKMIRQELKDYFVTIVIYKKDE